MNPMNQTIDHSAEYYDVLGCGPHSDHDQIHAEYRHRALLFHPDKNGDNNGDWNRIREAYEVLGDPQRRAQYDRWRASRLPVPFAQWRRA
ncbi:DnaJ sub C member 12, partial [Coemansia furcata]